jgi:hypothetical protein
MADSEVGYLSPSEMQRVWNAVLEFERYKPTQTQEARPYVDPPVLFRNDSGDTIPPYGCVQIVGTYDESQSSCHYATVKRPMQRTSAVLSTFAFNGPREVVDKDYGRLQAGPVFRAIKDSTTMSIGMRLGPVSSYFTLGKGCLFSYCGTDNVIDDCIRVVRNETPIHATAGGSGIAGNSSATVTSRYFDGTQWQAGSITYTAYNSTATAIAANAKLILFPVDGVWSAVEMCA